MPTAFIPGITGRLYQQFALTIAMSVLLSAFNALTLSPALAGLLLRPAPAGGGERRGPLAKFFGVFNRYWERATVGFVRWSDVVIRKGAVVLVVLVVCGLAGVFVAKRLPSSFLPDEDQGYVYVSMQLPVASSMERTSEAGAEVEKILAKHAWRRIHHHRHRLQPAELCADHIQRLLLRHFQTLGRSQIQRRAVSCHRESSEPRTQQAACGNCFHLLAARDSRRRHFRRFSVCPRRPRRQGRFRFLADNLNKFLAAARKRPEIGTINTTFLPSVPQRFIQVDREKVLKQGVALTDVYQTIQAYMGGLFINYFNDFGRTWQVYVESEAPYRSDTDNLGQFYVRNSQGAAVPLTALANFQRRSGPEFTLRYNEYRGAQINGSAAPGLQLGSGDRRAGRSLPPNDAEPKWASTTWVCRIRSRKRAREFPRG